MNILKFNHTGESRVFFTSDFHYGHNKEFIFNKRGFNSVQEHDIQLIKKWNSVVSNNDIVFHLGDLIIGVGNKGEEVFTQLMESLNFKDLYLMPGNHPSGWKQKFNNSIYSEENTGGKEIDKFWRLEVVFHSSRNIYLIPNLLEIIVNNQLITISHFPQRCWNAYNQKPPSVCLHGHTHGSLTYSRPTTLDRGKILDVGIESVGQPIDFQQVMEIMNNKSIRIESHHH